MITSNPSRGGVLFRVRVAKDSEEGRLTGLLTDSVIMTDNLATIRLNEIDRVLGEFSGMDKINDALKIVLGLNS